MGNILDGVTLNGILQLTDSNSHARLRNGTTFTQSDISSGSRLLFEGTTGANPPTVTTLNGATVNLAGGNLIADGNIQLTLAPTTTVRGSGGIRSDFFQQGAATVLNRDLISADASNQTLTINPDTFTNEGVVRAANGGRTAISDSGSSLTNYNAATDTLTGGRWEAIGKWQADESGQ